MTPKQDIEALRRLAHAYFDGVDAHAYLNAVRGDEDDPMPAANQETVYLALASRRARTRVAGLVGRDLPWVCDWGGRRGPKAACTRVTADEWALVQAKAWPGVSRCEACPLSQGTQQGQVL